MSTVTLDESTQAAQPGGAVATARDTAPAAPRHLPVGESIVRGALANFSAQPLTWGASLLAAAVVPRMLGSDAFGQLTIAFTITSLATPVLDLGIGNYLTRRVAQHPASVRRDIGVVLLLQLLTFGLGALAIVLLTPLVAPSLLDFRILDMAAVVLVVVAVQSVLTTTLRAQEHHVLYAWLSATIPVVSTLGTVLVVYAGGGVLAYTAAGMVLAILCTAFSWWVSGLRPVRPPLNSAFVEEARQFIRGGFPFLSWNVTMNIYGSVDRLLLAFFVPAFQVGWYAAANRIVGIPVFVPTLLTTPLFPVLSRSAHDPDSLRRAIGHTLRVMLLCMVPLSAAIFVAAPVVPTLFGWPSDFNNSIPSMMILSLQVPIVGVDMVLGTVIMAIGRERRWIKIGLLAAVLNIGGNLALIPLFDHLTGNGPIGASVVTVLTELWMFVGSLIVIPKALLEWRSISSTLRIVGAAVVAGLAASALLPFSFVVAAVVGATIYLLLVLVLRVASMDDVRYVTQRLARRRVAPDPGVVSG